MKRLLRTALILGLCLSLSMQTFALTTAVDGGYDKGADDPSTTTPGQGWSWDGTQGGTNVTVGDGVPSHDDMKDQAGNSFNPGNQSAGGTASYPNMFAYTPDMDAAAWQQNIRNQLAGGGTDKFWSDLQEATGLSKEDYMAKVANGDCPVVNIAPTLNVTANGQRQSLTMQGFLAAASGLSQSQVDAYAAGGRSQAEIMNAILADHPEVAGNFNTPPGVAGSANNLSGMFGFYYHPSRGFYDSNELNGVQNIKEEGSNRGGNTYLNICDILDPKPELEEEPPPPEVKEAGPLQEWKSKPVAFGEVKHNEYSINRTSEEWEAMAGIPHDETLFYDAGGSTHSAHYKTKDAQTYTTSKPSAPSPNTTCITTACPQGLCNAGPHCDIHPKCAVGHYGCPGHGSAPNTKYCAGPLGCAPTYPTCCEHVTCTIGPRKHSITVTFQMPAEIQNYYPMEGIDVRWMDTFQESLAWANPSSISVDADKLSATVVWESACGPGCDSFQGIADSYDCRVEPGCKPFAQAVIANLNRWRDEKFSWFITQTLDVTDRDGNTYNVLWDNDLEFFTVSWDDLEQCGSTNVVVKMKGSKVGERGVSDGEIINYPSDAIHEDRLPKKQTNFLPYEEEWSTTDKIEICGYNGLYSNPRRHYHGNPGDKHFFTQTGITISDIVNGEKTSGPGKLEFGPQGGGRLGNFFWGSGVDAKDNAPTEYYRGAGKVNNIVVHSPVALSQLYHSVYHLPFDQRYSPGPQGDTYLTPSLDFNIISSIEWSPKGVQTTQKGLADTTEEKGNGYYVGIDTTRWVEAKYYSFPFEVLYNGTRYGADSWIQIPVSENLSTFTLPVSEKEVSLAEYKGVVVAKNASNKDPSFIYDSDSEYQQNYERDGSPQGTPPKDANHGANNKNQVSILGRIGNFAIEYTDDPNWGPFFSKPTAGWQIPNVLQNVDIKQPNKFLGPHRDIFDRTHWTVSGNTYASIYPWGLDHYGGVPTLGKDLMGAILPAGEGKNNESYNNLLQYKPIKLGYTAWWSIQTIGNYGTAATKLQAQPQFYLFDPMAPETKQYVDVWTKVGTTYRRIYDHTDKENASAYTLDYFTKLNQPERRIGDVEKDRTALVVGDAERDNLFGEKVSINFGSPNGMTLMQNLRTFIGGTMWEDVNHQPNAVARSEADHAEQVQRWHGTIYLPASSKFTKPDEKEFLPTQVTDSSGNPVRNMLIGVEFVFKTEGAAPWNIWTKDSLIVGSNIDGYKPWIEVVPPETPDNPHDPDNPPTIHIDMPPPPNVPIVFDPNENSLQDISLHGTH